MVTYHFDYEGIKEMIKIAIVEDENDMALDLKKHIETFFNSNNKPFSIDIFDSAIKFLDKYKFGYNLVFMDINLPYMNGMSAAEKLRCEDEDVMIIFVTSLAQYAINGYKVNAFDYILKPVNYYNFSLTLERVLSHLKDDEESIVISSNKTSMKKISINKIKYIEINNHRIIFHTIDGNYETHGSLNYYADILKDHYFELCNRCYLVNLAMVSQVTPTSVVVDGESLIISRPKRKEFLHTLNKFIATGGGK